MVDDAYQRMSAPQREPSRTPHEKAWHELGLAWKDRTDAEDRLTDAVLALHAYDPHLLDQAVKHHAVPSREVNVILRRFRKLT